MTPRERVLATLRHQEPDRVPYDLGATIYTGIHHLPYARLREALGLETRAPTIWHLSGQLAKVDEDVIRKLHIDAAGALTKPSATWRFELEEDEEYRYYTDEWGIRHRMPKDKGLYYDVCCSPLAEADDRHAIARHRFPDPDDRTRLTGLRDAANWARRNDLSFVMGSLGAGMFEMGQRLRGFTAFMEDLIINQPLAEALLDRILELKLAYWRRVLDELDGLVDIAAEPDDYGMQSGLFMSPALWRKLFKPRLRQLFTAIKRQAPVFIFFHTCGSVYDILPDLIEIGVDILNPVQVSAKNMNSARLKREFGEALTFWGGGVDTQEILPRGTPGQVKDEVTRRIHDLAPGGGFVFTTVHTIQADVPPENILAMWDTLQAEGAYRR